jgi:glutathione S-transferase
MSTDKLILLTYTGVGQSGYGGMFALAGGFKATITARLNGADLEVRGFPLGDGKLYEWGLNLRRLEPDEIPQGTYTYRKDPAFVGATGGYGTIPALLSPDGTWGCCESNAIARMVARSGRTAPMYGTTPWETAQIDMFLDKCLVFERDQGPWIDATLFGASGGFELTDASRARHESEARKWLAALDGHLEGRTTLVGERLSVADVVLACQMLVPWCCMLDDSVKTSVPHVAAHLDRLWRVPEVDEDLGDAVHALTTEFAARRGRIETTS